jgi:hypothetical protein
MKILIDTNVALDILLDRREKYFSEDLTRRRGGTEITA